MSADQLVEKNSDLDTEVRQEVSDDEKFDVKTEVSGLSAAIDFTLDDVNAIVPTEDEDLPASTLRMWVMSFVLSAVLGGVDSFFSLRYPTIMIGAIVAQVVSYPIGEFWYYVVPSWHVPLPWGLGFNLNPGHFNYKEHACIYIFNNVVLSTNLVNSVVTEDFKFFNASIGINRMILFNLSSFLIGWCLTGLTKDILVTPARSMWPGVLGTCAMFKTFHSKENAPAGNWTISRFKFFAIVFAGSFTWYWFPDLIMPFLSTIGAWISWCKPSSPALAQVFGVTSGLGLFPLTFDWTQIASMVSNPLTTPFWSVCCVFFSFVFWIWIVMPGLYYKNHWQTAHLPIMSSSIFDYQGNSYNASKVVDGKWNFDYEKYKTYSPVMLPIAFLMNIALGLAAFSAMIVSFCFRFKHDVWTPLTTLQSDVHNNAMTKYKNFPYWVYAIVGAVGLGMGFGFSGAYYDMTQFKADSFIVSIIIASGLFVPLALIESQSNFEVSLASFYEIVSAFWLKGQPMALMYFYTMGFGTMQHAMHCTQGAKIGHYMKVPPRTVMVVLFFACVWASIVCPSVDGFVLEHFKNICTSKAANNMTCRKAKVQYNTHLVWGLFGSHIFNKDGRYSWVLWFFLVGVLVAVALGLLQMWKPKSIIKKLNPVLFFGGAGMIPSVTGFNYSTWFAFAMFFNFFLHRGRHAWWKKYNLVLAVALDCGVAIAAILIYFAVVYTGGSANYSWWGTTVGTTGCDATGCPHLSGPMTKPTEW